MSVPESLHPAVITNQDPRFEERYRAMSSRDARFDGQFITGVHSTGIYCRPSCPATTPKPANVLFYRTAAAAHEAGLRACKRCLPDAVPGSPEWNLHDDVASRAMRLIVDGTVERDGVPALAARLGYTPRHLTRVLSAELGAGPLALSRAHRAQTARTLLLTTSLPIADVAFAAGFSSIRQFNETVRSVYEMTPSALRARGRRGAESLTDDATARSITLRLPVRQPYDGAGIFRFLADHAIDGIETSTETSTQTSTETSTGTSTETNTGTGTNTADAATFARALRLPHGTATVALTLDAPDSVLCTARLDDLSDLTTLVARIRRLLDLDADSEAIDAALGADELLAPLVAGLPGIRLPGSVDAEETLFRTMIGQQISVAAARTVLSRLATGLSATPGLFPTAAEIAENGRNALRGPSTRVASIIAVAGAIADGTVRIDVGMPAEELVASLVALPGIGPWTANYVAMRVLGNPDILLSTDLVMLSSAGKLGLPPTPRGLAEYGERWAPWRSYAGLHLWRAR